MTKKQLTNLQQHFLNFQILQTKESKIMKSDKSGTVRRALISVSDKSGIVPFAKSLTELEALVEAKGLTFGYDIEKYK